MIKKQRTYEYGAYFRSQDLYKKLLTLLQELPFERIGNGEGVYFQTTESDQLKQQQQQRLVTMCEEAKLKRKRNVENKLVLPMISHTLTSFPIRKTRTEFNRTYRQDRLAKHQYSQFKCSVNDNSNKRRCLLIDRSAKCKYVNKCSDITKDNEDDSSFPRRCLTFSVNYNCNKRYNSLMKCNGSKYKAYEISAHRKKLGNVFDSLKRQDKGMSSLNNTKIIKRPTLLKRSNMKMD